MPQLPKAATPSSAVLLWLVASCGGPPVAQEGTVLVTATLPDRVMVLDAATGQLRDSIPLDPRPVEIDEPHGLAASQDGRHWYATVSHGEPTLWKFERPANRLVGRVSLGISGAARIGITPDGRMALVPDYYRDAADRATPGQVAVVRLRDLVVTERLEPCPGPHDAEVSPDGTVAAVACSLSDEVVLLDLSTLEPTRRWELAGVAARAPPRAKPLNLVWAAEGDRLYVTLHLAGSVVELVRAGDDRREVSVGAGPTQLALSPDGATLVVANRLDGTVSLVDPREMTELGRIDLAVSHPHGVAIAADGSTAFISYEGDTGSDGGVIAVDLTSGEQVWRSEVGQYPLGVMYLTAER